MRNNITKTDLFEKLNNLLNEGLGVTLAAMLAYFLMQVELD